MVSKYRPPIFAQGMATVENHFQLLIAAYLIFYLTRRKNIASDIIYLLYRSVFHQRQQAGKE